MGGRYAMSSPLDQPIHITIFPDLQAKTRESLFISLLEFAELLRNERAATKQDLRLFSMCSYGSDRTSKKSLRHDRNIRECFALVGDYDGGRVSPADAALALHRAGLCALLVTTPSYTKEHPRWRVIAPLSDPLHYARANATGFEMAHYGKLISRLAGVFPENLAAESWNRSQGWYLGTHASAPDHAVTIIQ
jgi:hypothetical protein